MGEYFGRRSYKMGALEGSGALSSSERVSQIITTGTYSGEAKSPQQNLAPFTKLQNLTHELSLLKFHLAYPPTSCFANFRAFVMSKTLPIRSLSFLGCPPRKARSPRHPVKGGNLKPRSLLLQRQVLKMRTPHLWPAKTDNWGKMTNQLLILIIHTTLDQIWQRLVEFPSALFKLAPLLTRPLLFHQNCVLLQ